MNDLAALDLNLLVVLEALFAERHVSRAALRLNKSQPAVSQALGRLRQTFDDPLLIRGADGWELTARAREMEPMLAETLAAVRGLMRPAPFDPAQTRRTYRLTMSDYASAMLAPRLLPVLRKQAPGVQLSITTRSRDAAMAALVDGDIDLALGVFPDRPAEVREGLLLEERFVCVMDRSTLEPGFDLAAYLARPHVSVAVQDGRVDEVDGALGRLGQSRDVVATLPHWSVAQELQRRHPQVRVDADAIYVREGPYWTSAGVTAGIDLALAVVEQDFGHALALEVARDLVMYLKRPGGQSQFSVQLASQAVQHSGVRLVQQWVLAHLDQPMQQALLADKAAMSERHFRRVFQQETGVTPSAFVENARLEGAKQLLETRGDLPLKTVAAKVGLGSEQALRHLFQKRLGITPVAYRERFGD